VVSSQENKSDSLDLERLFYDPPRYNNVPYICPDGTIKLKEYDMNSPYEYKSNKPMVLKASDSLLVHWLNTGKIIRERKMDTVPVF